MATVTDPSIRFLRALRGKLTAIADLPPVAWLGVPFTAPVDEPYLEEMAFRHDPFPAELGAPGMLQRTRGFYQIDLIAPSGKGADAAFTLADRLLTALRALVFAVSGTRVRGHVLSTAVGSPAPEPPNGLRLPLTVYLTFDF